ncbi:hypothetical protein BC834DRAFT_819570 [Gloeopeniophorella convolvens]|nr:hypothetical protein BC834DRAFT_819570 [Gloeopeniophorella convolvens]
MFDDAVYDLDELVDGDGWESHNGRSGGGYQEHLPSSNGHENGGQDRQPPGGNESYGGGGYGGGEGRGGEGGGGDRRKDGRDGKTPSGSSTPSDSESEESEDEGTRRLAQDSQSAAPKPASSDDDDVPLARSIPTALRAQRTIRKQVRDENDERRRLRALQRQQAQLPRDEAQQHQAQIGVSPSRVPVPLAHSTSRAARPRTKTLPSNTARPVPADDLARRLRDIQVASHSPTSSPKNHLQALADPASAADQFGRLSGDHARAPSVGSQNRSLRPARSFHRPRTADPPLAPTPPPPYDPHRLGRSATTASRPTRQRDPFETNPPVTLPLRAKSIRRPRTSEDAHPAGRTSVEQRAPVPRASADVGGTGTGAASGFQVVSREAKPVSWQQRVFIVDLQRFNTLEMGPGTTAKEILETLDSQGQLANWAGAGGWMLFEVSQDFGMERPIRHYEVVSEIISSWDKDKSVNLLVAKKTPLAARLHPSAMPSSSPVCSGYIEWESKRGKWSKRWLELREQGLWLSKKDNGKDETFLCSLANFDAYVVTRLHKSPKPYVFAVKSTDNLTFFESAADYVHTFCCSEKDGLKWVESILLARSYFINQERNVLSATGAPGPRSTRPSRALAPARVRHAPRSSRWCRCPQARLQRLRGWPRRATPSSPGRCSPSGDRTPTLDRSIISPHHHLHHSFRPLYRPHRTQYCMSHRLVVCSLIYWIHHLSEPHAPRLSLSPMTHTLLYLQS